jgi:hypothetical protein
MRHTQLGKPFDSRRFSYDMRNRNEEHVFPVNAGAFFKFRRQLSFGAEYFLSKIQETASACRALLCFAVTRRSQQPRSRGPSGSIYMVLLEPAALTG